MQVCMPGVAKGSLYTMTAFEHRYICKVSNGQVPSYCKENDLVGSQVSENIKRFDQ